MWRRYTLIAPARSRRPRVSGPSECPFCRGREHLTPPATGVARTRGGVVEVVWGDAEGWSARLFPNKYPAVPPGEGVHEVLVESPRHVKHPYEDLESYTAALHLAAARIRSLYQGGAVFVAWFKNAGKAAGASIDHIHSQIVAMYRGPKIPEPPAVGGGLLAAGCGGLGVYVDPEPIASYHVYVAPHGGREPFWGLDGEGFMCLSRLVAVVARFYIEELGVAGYNMWAYIPAEGAPWRIDVAPARSFGGLEVGYGVYIVDTSPTVAARRLREYIGGEGFSGSS